MAGAGWIDSHCHLQSLPEDQRERALDRAREAGVHGFLVPAIHLDDAEVLLALAHRHPDVWCALGVHPHEAASWTDDAPARLRALLSDPRVVAVGECGLDFHYLHAPEEAQGRALRAQWELALEFDLPVVVHNRDSDAAMQALVEEPAFAGLRADFHSFAGAPELAQAVLARGHTVGVSGMVTFRAADNIRELLAGLPADRILVETDTPYLAPVPHRGKPNEPAWVVEVGLRVAAERGWSPEETAARTSANFRRLFDRTVPPGPGPAV